MNNQSDHPDLNGNSLVPQTSVLTRLHHGLIPEQRADEGTRTLYLRIGNPWLYQMSYIRINIEQSKWIHRGSNPDFQNANLAASQKLARWTHCKSIARQARFERAISRTFLSDGSCMILPQLHHCIRIERVNGSRNRNHHPRDPPQPHLLLVPTVVTYLQECLLM